MRLLGGERLFHNASSWSKCCDCARAACSGLPMFCCDPMLFISAIFEISSMLVETENLLLSRSSTWAIMTDDVRWAYFFCHEYVSNDNSFLRSRLAGRFAAAGLKSVNIFPHYNNLQTFLLLYVFYIFSSFHLPHLLLELNTSEV